MEEPEIKYQCTCCDFWHYYKCEHSLAMSIAKNGVPIPPQYHLAKIGEKKCRGRPENAHPGEALGAAPKRARVARTRT